MCYEGGQLKLLQCDDSILIVYSIEKSSIFINGCGWMGASALYENELEFLKFTKKSLLPVLPVTHLFLFEFPA